MRRRRPGRLAAGLIAATSGTAALNIVTYLDMALRGRPPSQVPSQAAGKLAEGFGLDLGGDDGDDKRSNRKEALGALMGYVAGLGSVAPYLLGGRRFEQLPVPVQAATVTLAALLAGNAPPISMGLTDPRKWSSADWWSDIIPHAAYGTVTAAVYHVIRR